MTGMRFAAGVAGVLALCGCAGSKTRYGNVAEEGRTRGVPLIIYDISANNPQPSIEKQPLAIGLLNTQDAPIASVTLTVASCNTMGQFAQPRDIRLEGPFESNTSVVLAPMGADSTGRQVHLMLPHVVITAVEVADAGGTHKFEGKDVKALLDDRIANYCISRAM